MSELPAGWTSFALKDIGGLSGGKTPSKANSAFWSSPDVPWVSPKDMKKSLLEDAEDRISQTAVDEAGMTLYPAGSVLMVTRSGILQHTFPVALAGAELTVNQDIKVLRPVEGIAPQFAFYLLKSFGGEILSACSKDGTTVQSIDSEKLEAFAFPLPPFAEQTRIAAKLDELLAQVDTLKARIDGIPALLKRFRQSVLAAAVSGRLTEEWREEGSLADWSYSPLKELGRISTGSTPSKKDDENYGGDFFLVKPGDLGRGTIFYADERLSAKGFLACRRLRKGAVLVSCIGNLGRVGIAGVELACNQQINAIEFYNEKIIDCYGYYACHTLKAWLEENSSATTIQIVNKGRFSEAVLPVPPLAEQTEIVHRVEQLFAFADQLEAKVGEAKKRIDRLTQSILAKAFRGELVPQDPDDEPASALLARIQAQRAAAPKTGRGRRKATSA